MQSWCELLLYKKCIYVAVDVLKVCDILNLLLETERYFKLLTVPINSNPNFL